MEVGVFVVYVAGPGFLPGSTAFGRDGGEKRSAEIALRAAPEVELRVKRRK
jgi:hypothetical protein